MPASSLFWRHVGRRTNDDGLSCQRLVVLAHCVGVEKFGDTKIEDLDTRLRQNDVPWFQVSMNHALLVGGGERVGYRDSVTKHTVHG